MDKIYISPLAFAGSDREKIQAAVEEAVRTDLRVIRIPQKDEGAPWELDGPVLLPGDVTLILDGATVKSAGIAFSYRPMEYFFKVRTS